MSEHSDTNPFLAARELAGRFAVNELLFSEADGGPEQWAMTAFHAGIRGPIPEELFDVSTSTPLLRWTDPNTPAVGLLDAMIQQPNHRASNCDRCSDRLSPGVPVHRLWVPGGQSVVEFQLCHHCANVCNDVYRRDGERALVWC